MISRFLRISFGTALLAAAAAIQLSAQDIPVPADTLSAADTLKKKPVVADTTVFHAYQPLHSVSTFYADSVFLFSDYRAAADVLQILPGTFTRSLGTIGQPEELTRYGIPSYYTGYFSDGLLLNERNAGTCDVNLLRADAVDSMEAVPLPRSFLKGSMNFPAAVNFLMASRVSRQPLTRIRYYEGTNDEGAIDVQMQQLLSKKTNLEVQFANRKKDAGYDNSGLSSWLIGSKISYASSRALTLLLSHEYSRHVPSLFGGVNVDTLKKLYANPTAVVYDEIRAPVMSKDTYYKQNQNTIRFSAIYRPSAGFSTVVDVFRSDNLLEFRKDETLPASNPERYVMNRRSEVAGADILQTVQLAFARLRANAGFENRAGTEFPFLPEYAGTRYYFSAALSAPLGTSGFTPSFFAKTVVHNGNALNGAGADIALSFGEKLSAYAGAAMFESDDILSAAGGKHSWKVLEAKAAYSTAELFAEANVFYIDAPTPPAVNIVRRQSYIYDTALVETAPLSSAGCGLSARYCLGFLLFEGNANIIAQRGAGKQSVPLFSGRAGVYYTGVHFDSNLTAKAGIYSNFRTGFNPMNYDAFYSRAYFVQGIPALSGHGDANFFAAGDIIKRAIVYFAWENILDRQYFTVPYFPMPRRGIRFGLTWLLFN